MKKTLTSLALLFTASSMQTQAAPEVLPLYTDDIKKMALESTPAFPPELVLKGKQENWMKILHQGEVVVALYESTPAVIDVKEPFPYDEFVVVLEGEVTLTHTNGQKQTYKTGENFLVPKGWTGTWDMPEHYREMIVVETKAWTEAEG
jgi:uncharacterized cupin superfamily protein